MTLTEPQVLNQEARCIVGCYCAYEGLSTTRFGAGDYAVVEVKGDASDEAGMGIGPAVMRIDEWLDEHGHTEGDEGSLACQHE